MQHYTCCEMFVWYVCFFVCTIHEIIWDVWISIGGTHAICPAFILCVCYAVYSASWFHCLWVVFLPTCWSSTTVQSLLCIAILYPASLKDAGLSPDTAKNLHLATLSLYLNSTEQIPSLSIFELYVFNATTFFFVACNASVVDLGNRYFKFLNGIRWPLTTESMFYVIWVLFDLY